jgi:hypothetical protein
VVIVALVAASLLLRGGDDSGSDAPPASTVSPSTLLDGIPQDRAILGANDATVTLIQFEDLQCPVCKTYQEEGSRHRQGTCVPAVEVRFVITFLGPTREGTAARPRGGGREAGPSPRFTQSGAARTPGG